MKSYKNGFATGASHPVSRRSMIGEDAVCGEEFLERPYESPAAASNLREGSRVLSASTFGFESSI